MENDKNNNSGQNYQVISEIGKGAYGKVYKVKDINTGLFYAIKRLNKEDIMKDEYLKNAYHKELFVMKESECENSVKLVEEFRSNNYLNIVMELCDGDLENWLNKHKALINEDQLKEILLGLNNCFKIMDSKNIVHRDLKLKNIMINYKKSQNQVLDIVPKLSDFGFSKMLDESDITKTKLGTPVTMAPEIMTGINYTKKCDVWSMGVIIYQLLFKILPFKAKNEMELKQLVLSNKGFKIPDGLKISDQLHDLLKKMLTVDPKKRISWSEYFKHPFFKNDKDIELERFEKNYEYFNKLSEDNQGTYNIFKAKSISTGEMVYIKEIDRILIDSKEEYIKILETEIKIMKELSDKGDYFIKYIDFFLTKKKYLIVTEYFEGPLLESYINKEKPLSDSMIIELIFQIISGIYVFNEEKIVLQSFTTKSLCFKYYKDTENFHIKFFDYGLAKIFNESSFEKTFNLNQKICSKTNILSLGIIIYKLCFRFDLFNFTIENTISDEEIVNKSKIFIQLWELNYQDLFQKA